MSLDVAVHFMFLLEAINALRARHAFSSTTSRKINSNAAERMSNREKCVSQNATEQNGKALMRNNALYIISSFFIHWTWDIVKTNGKYLRKIIHLFGGIVCVYFYSTFYRIYASTKQHKQTIPNAGIKLKLFTKQSLAASHCSLTHSFTIPVLCSDSFQKILRS